MIVYNTKEWLSFILSFNKGDTIRKLWVTLIFVGCYAGIISYLELDFLKLSENSTLKNITVIQGLLGFVLSLLLVFRTNTAYDRWWEGRKHWGKLVNDSRNLALKFHAILDTDDIDNRKFFAEKISLFSQVLNLHLTKDTTRFSLDEKDHPEISDLFSKNHPPSETMALLYDKVNQFYKDGKISGEQLIYLNEELKSFMEICGACERIKNTPIPYSYMLFIKKFIAFYVFSLPIGYVFSLGYWVIPMTVFVFYVLISLELIAEEIEDPFNNDLNDIPTQKIANMIEVNVHHILLDKF